MKSAGAEEEDFFKKWSDYFVFYKCYLNVTLSVSVKVISRLNCIKVLMTMFRKVMLVCNHRI